jgi:putative hydrolase of HD superfamily
MARQQAEALAGSGKSKELLQGKEFIKKTLKEKGKVDGVDFYKLALEIEEHLMS